MFSHSFRSSRMTHSRVKRLQERRGIKTFLKTRPTLSDEDSIIMCFEHHFHEIQSELPWVLMSSFVLQYGSGDWEGGTPFAGTIIGVGLVTTSTCWGSRQRHRDHVKICDCLWWSAGWLLFCETTGNSNAHPPPSLITHEKLISALVKKQNWK